MKIWPIDDHRIAIRFDDGVAGEVDLSDDIASGGVFAALADRVFFEQVKIGGDGRWIEWPGEIDLCADALRREVTERVNEMY